MKVLLALQWLASPYEKWTLLLFLPCDVSVGKSRRRGVRRYSIAFFLKKKNIQKSCLKARTKVRKDHNCSVDHIYIQIVFVVQRHGYFKLGLWKQSWKERWFHNQINFSNMSLLTIFDKLRTKINDFDVSYIRIRVSHWT